MINEKALNPIVVNPLFELVLGFIHFIFLNLQLEVNGHYDLSNHQNSLTELFQV